MSQSDESSQQDRFPGQEEWAEPRPSETEQPPWQVEAPRASGLAVWVWCLAVGALFPILGIPLAGVLAICSAILLLRGEPLPWDRRIGFVGLTLSITAFAVSGLWLTMLFLRAPWDETALRDFELPADQPWAIMAVQLGVLVVSIMLHECAHAVAAYWSGDRTAAKLGRISLNPVVHVDPFGSIILPAILLMSPAGFVLGWAKPVPVNARQFRYPRRGLLAVTLAGVSVNAMLALACAGGLLAVGSALRLLFPGATTEGFAHIFAACTIEGAAYEPAWEMAVLVFKQGIIVNIILLAFNILPIPPLDGFGVLESLAPPSLSPLVAWLRSIGWIVLWGLVLAGVLSYVLLPGIIFAMLLNLVVGLVTGWA